MKGDIEEKIKIGFCLYMLFICIIFAPTSTRTIMVGYKDVYINPHTDFGFKRLFGTDLNSDLLISFLNALFRGKQNVKSVTYLNPEQLGTRPESRRAIFDVYCENDRDEKFIVEMQNVYQEFFKDRTIYYSTFPIREQAERGGWDFQLNGVYTIGLLNYVFQDDADDIVDVEMPWHHEVKLMDIDRHTIFYDKLTYIYEEIPKFNKTEAELVTMFDKWMYVLRNLSRLMERPAALQERVFVRLFEQAEIALFDAEELRSYEDNLKAYRDIDNAIRTAEKIKFREGREEGRAEGREEGRAEGRAERDKEIAWKLKAAKVDTEVIAQTTGLSIAEIESL